MPDTNFTKTFVDSTRKTVGCYMMLKVSNHLNPSSSLKVEGIELSVTFTGLEEN